MSNASSTEVTHVLDNIRDWTPSPLLRNGHLQTLWSVCRAAPVLQKSLPLQIASRAPFTWTGHLYTNNHKRVAILMHGLGGKSNSAYMLEATKALLDSGYDVACMALPGNEHPDAYTYHAGDYVYLQELEAFFSSTYDHLHWMGFSLGGNMVLKWLAHAKRQAKSMVISPVIDLSFGVDQVDQKAYGLYRRHFLKSLTQVIDQKLTLHKETFFPYASALRSHTLRGFDQAITCPFHGYTTTEAYYKVNQALGDLQHIPTPTLILAAKDDPFSMPSHFMSVDTNPHVQTLLPRYGGHVGFFQGMRRQSMLGQWITDIFQQQ